MDQETVQRVARCVAEVLALEPDEIRADSRLIDDLAADSLDLVELMYLLEQEFDIRLDKHDLSLSAQLGLPEEQIHENEVLTDRALELLREKFPHATDRLVSGITRRDLASLLTVGEIALAVEKKRRAQQEKTHAA